jgi:murein DD-endopeptidase MepM/ murein hydrolase activator NlpD
VRAPAHTPVPARARAPRFARTLLLGILAVALGGLALPGPTAAPVRLVASDPAEPTLLRRAVAPVVEKPAAPRRTPARATRSRPRPAAPSWVSPLRAPLVSPYGMRWGRMHEGIDLAAPSGTPVRAIGSGTVLGAGYLGSENGYGIIVLVRHRNGLVSAYAHLSRAAVRAGERVKAGEVIGRVGSTGHSTGPHLHFEIRNGSARLNPARWLRQHGVRL